MTGHVIMEIEPDEMKAAMALYLNQDALYSNGRGRQPVTVTAVRQRSNGNFVVEFDGWRPAEPKQSEDGPQ